MQRWVHEQGWTTLRDAQERAIGPVLDASRDVIISASTAAGKTEAAFLPICSNLAHTRDAEANATRSDPWTSHDPWSPPLPELERGVEVLYLSPLKALINDQYERLEMICDRVRIPVHRWHGDVAASAKRRVHERPSGVLLMTPESLEAQFVNRGTELPRLLGGLQYVVIDELHSFLHSPRGAQLQSLLNRIELVLQSGAARIGLSATLADMESAATFLRPTAPDNVEIIDSSRDGKGLSLQLRGYRATVPEQGASRSTAHADGTSVPADAEQPLDGHRLAIADHVFRTLRGNDNLVFANTRRDVELYADLLARRCERERLPNEFWAHHGSLARDVREVVEAQLKDRSRPVTAVCTSTLEMGIDIDSVVSVAQIGTPPSVAALRQRLGRSGRRDDPAVLRVYITEDDLDVRSSPVDQLRCGLVQSIAMIRLLLARWLEPAEDPGLNLSTLVQQVLSVIAQHGGATAAELYRALCGLGPFAQVDVDRFDRVLRAMGAADLIMQTGDGTLLHGQTGERFVNHYSFYSAFQTPKEWQLVADGRPLGTLPTSQPLAEGGMLIFAGRRWKITSIDESGRVVELTRAAGGVPPHFGGGPALVGDRVRAEMVNVYRSDEIPVWLDEQAKALLAEGRAAWRRLGLDDTHIVPFGNDTIILPWVGDHALTTAALMLGGQDLEVSVDGPVLTVTHSSAEAVVDAAQSLLTSPALDPLVLARRVKNKAVDKWDWVLDADLAAEATAARLVDTDGAARVLEALVADAPAVRLPSATVEPTVAGQSTGGFRGRRPAATVEDQEFCVVDVETTGFSPRLGDRVIEVAAVRMRGNGVVIDEWVTLVNPNRDLGATDIHGISAGDVLAAPQFAEVAGDLLRLLDGAVIVAHNLRFDWSFLLDEYDRAGHKLPALPGLCTLALGSLLNPGAASRKLAACCARIGHTVPEAHAALHDARAAAALLASYVAMARQKGMRDLAALGCAPLEWPPQLPQLEATGLQCLRSDAHQHVAEEASYLARLVGRLDDAGVDPDTAAYLDLLDHVLEDRRLSRAESEALAETAGEWGLTAAAVREVHQTYLRRIAGLARADGIVTEAEFDDLHRVATLLGLPSEIVDAATSEGDAQVVGSASPPNSNPLAGHSVCFTGTLRGALDGSPVTRTVAKQLAQDAGLEVRNSVTRDLDLLVIADPDSMSRKAERARELGTRIISERAFWPMIGAPVQ